MTSIEPGGLVKLPARLPGDGQPSTDLAWLSKPVPENRQAVLERLFRMVSDLVVVTDRDGRIMLVNPAWEDTLGWSEDELVGRPVFELVHPDDARSTRGLAVQAGSVSNYTNRYRHKDGSWRWLLWSGRSDGEVWYAVAKDITERLQLERRALCDELTGLANRALILDRLRGALVRMEQVRDRMVAVLFIDLDGFKLVNDAHGHAAGDRVLAEVASRLRDVARSSDEVSRFGGDEFVIVAEDLTRDAEALRLAERVIEVVEQDFTLAAAPYSLSCSVGVATTPDFRSDPDVILREADAAMYRAKMGGSGQIELFRDDMSLEGGERSDLAQELSCALRSEELIVFYQPIVAVADLDLVGCEALVRWNHPDHGLMLPDRFVPLCETTGLIVPLGRQVLIDACRQAGEWRRRGLELMVSVNVSRRQLLEPGFIDDVCAALEQGGVPGRAICLEVTETAGPIRHLAVVEVLREMRRLEIKIALDDFGTGYSTLANLRELPIDMIKVDRSFVSGIARGGGDRGIVRAVLALAGELGVSVVAEGVESDEQLEALREMECPLAQGYLFAPALPASRLLAATPFSPRDRPPVS